MVPNRFDVLRLGAALAVYLAHGSFLYRTQVLAPLPDHSVGSLAVYTFFFISGYLIAQSWERRPIWRVFWAKRVARIFPGLAVAVLFTVAIIGVSFTNMSPADYWQSSATWTYLFNNMVGLSTAYTLPGVFESNPFPHAVNGSLWTIRYELAMYMLLALLATGGYRWVYPATSLALLSLWLFAHFHNWDAASPRPEFWITKMFAWRDFTGFGVPFFLGSTFAVYRVRVKGWMAGAATLAAFGALLAESAVARQGAVWLFIAFGVFYIAHAGVTASCRVSRRKRIDLSYGVYIYAFPIQQALTQIGLKQEWPWPMYMTVTLSAIFVLAWLSWHWVEEPFIRLAQRVGNFKMPT